MFERYSESARRVIHWSRYMASRVGSPEIETEHLLLGVLRADKTLARRFLGSPWAAEIVWRKIEQRKPVRQKTPGVGEIPLSNSCKRALTYAAEEANLLSNMTICTEHLLVGLLRDRKCLAAEIMSELGVHLATTQEDLRRIPHDDSVTEQFVRAREPLPDDVAESHVRIKSIRTRMEAAIADHNFAEARVCSDEEEKEREKLYLLCQRHGLLDWIYD